jgi:hypothetical protein
MPGVISGHIDSHVTNRHLSQSAYVQVSVGQALRVQRHQLSERVLDFAPVRSSCG